jgi:hypothetical protein
VIIGPAEAAIAGKFVEAAQKPNEPRPQSPGAPKEIVTAPRIADA